MTRFLRRLRARLRYRQFNAELKDEFDVHRAMAEDELRATGATPEDVQRQASRQLGNVTLARESARGVWIAPWVESVWQDVRYGVRTLWHSPGFTATALLTLTLGIGVNTTVFSLANALLLQPWRAPDAHELVLAYPRVSGGTPVGGVSASEFTFLRQNATSTDLAGTRVAGGDLIFDGTTRSVRGRLVSGNYFSVLKAPIVVGRGLQPDDDQPGRAAVIVLAHDIWASVFSSNAAVVGTTITLRGVPVIVVGVAGPNVQESPLTDAPEFWLPLWAMPVLFPEDPFAQAFMSDAGNCCIDLVGRLRPGESRTRAQAELSVLDRQFRGDERDGLGMRVTGTEMLYRPQIAEALPVLGLLFTGVALVLLLACANVGNLQLARASARRREVTVRLALGAARRRIVRQLLTEGLVLAVAATFICLVVSAMVARALMTQMDASLARVIDFSLDTRVLLFAACLTVVTCLLTSLAPALRSTRHLTVGRTSDGGGLRLRSTFLAAQVAISIVLIVAAGLLGRGLVQAASQDLGFTLDTLVAMKVDRPAGRQDGPEFLRDVMAAARAVSQDPVAASILVPLGDGSLRTGARRAGESEEADRPVRVQPVSSNYFDVLGIPVRSGRTFSDTTTDEVVLNETLARMLWPDGDAVGNHLASADGAIGRRVVGVVGDAYLSGLNQIEPTIFQPAGSLSYLLFNEGTVTPDQLRAIVSSVDASATVAVHAVGNNVSSSLEAATYGARIAGGLGLLALALVTVGTAGVFSFVVTERTREIGIRLALGASRQRVRALLFRRAGRPVLIGLLAGLLLAAFAGPVLRSYLYGLDPSVPYTYVLAVSVVVLAAWLSTIVPMRRALRIDPAITLRHE